MKKSASEVAARSDPVAAVTIESPPVLELDGDWNNIWESPVRDKLETAILPRFLRAQRWFGGKARQVQAVRVVDHGVFPQAGPAACFLLLLAVEFTEGNRDLYFVPLAAKQLAPEPPAANRVLAYLALPESEGMLIDALADEDFCTALLDAIGQEKRFDLSHGVIHAFPTDAFSLLRGNPEVALPVVLGSATSSNSLLFYGRRLLLKLFRRLEVGINPDFEIGRYLTEQVKFDRIPHEAGAIEYHRTDGAVITLANLQALIDNQGDGWKHTLDELSRYYQHVRAQMPSPDPERQSVLELAEVDPPSLAQETIAEYLHAAATLGTRTAELHLALSCATQDPAFVPEPFTAADLGRLREKIIAQGNRSLKLLKENRDRLTEDIIPLAERLLEVGPEALQGLVQVVPGGCRIRCHGDYHLGQVLRVENDYVILDFEGEPAKSVEERRDRQSPLRDVAGMLRSYHYAAYAGLFAFIKNHPDDLNRLEPWAELWQQWVCAAFLRAYLATAAGGACLPEDRTTFATLLQWFTLEKAFYELEYELNNRPDWVQIPLSGILSLVDRRD